MIALLQRVEILTPEHPQGSEFSSVFD